jgi:ABC-type antimicrobial peptide transport system permease subunit
MIILKALIVLLVVSILEIILIRSILNLRFKDYFILGSMGMNHRTIKLMNYFEMFCYTALSILTVSAAAKAVSLFMTGYPANMVKYYSSFHLVLYAAFNLSVIALTVWSFNRYLKRRQKWSKYDTVR